jgi:hypothetical protein
VSPACDPALARIDQRREAQPDVHKGDRMKVVRLSAAGLLLVAAVAACNAVGPAPASPSPTGPSSRPSASTASAPAGLCGDLAAAYAERGALGDAFRSLIAGDDASARAQAAAVRSRMASLVNGLPPAGPLASADAIVRNAVEDFAGLMTAAADELDPPSGAFDRQAALQDGPATLDLMDMTMSHALPGSPIATACPGVAYVAAPVSFPPPAGPEVFGLPASARGIDLHARVGSVSSDMEHLLRSLGIDPATVRYIRVDMTEGGASVLDVLDGVSATPRRILDGLPEGLIATVSAKTAARTVNGFSVVRRGDRAVDPIVITVAVRGSRAMVFYNQPDAIVDAVLEGTTQ